MKIKIFISLLFLLFIFWGNQLYAQQLVYNPINPSFVGGNPYNATWLLSEAQAQNDIAAPQTNALSSYNQDPLADFKNSLNRQILSELSRRLITSVFGDYSDNKLNSGHYELGDYIIDITPSDQGIIINIIDNLTGNQTNVVVPYY